MCSQAVLRTNLYTFGHDWSGFVFAVRLACFFSHSFSLFLLPIWLSVSVSFYVSFDPLYIHSLCVYVATSDEREAYKTNDKPYRCFSFEHFSRRTSRTKTKIQIETSRTTEINRLLYLLCVSYTNMMWWSQRKNYHTAASFVAYRNANAIRRMRVFACVWMFWQKKK